MNEHLHHDLVRDMDKLSAHFTLLIIAKKVARDDTICQSEQGSAILK